jgi:predicted RNA-binding protein YlqC (UPF0109 family)
MPTIDQQFVEFIVKSLVNNPDNVQITRRIDEKGVLLELTVDPDDLGRIIGKRGATAQSLRTLLRALGTKNDARYNLKIVDNDLPPSEREEDKDSVPEDTTPVETEDSGKVVDESTDQPVEERESVASRTRKELAELDDLDI